jgi:transketolase
MHTIKPLDVKLIRQIASSHKQGIFTLEEHYTEGGLGSAVAEVLSENGYTGTFKRFGIEKLEKHIGHAEYLRECYGLVPEKLYKKILKILER